MPPADPAEPQLGLVLLVFCVRSYFLPGLFVSRVETEDLECEFVCLECELQPDGKCQLVVCKAS